ncbi:ATP-binding protein [Bailinhaonella thermotolerans]|uniref:ATP-binding protein n=1 Tax=Bailinhaonella thermotolerans TaxID=1070861 RepID=A0A3A4BCI2_9ACTN|nr:ATP-binding protein [Bailinhaonella thermotolerans]RJL31908.1 ATP-binding protein [Bailinhaonella thermotolerans]
MSLQVNVRPHGRILSVLGDIEFSQWQCLAELIDNSFDDFLSQGSDAYVSERPTVTVSLPGRNSEVRTAEVWIRDNGRGMDLETLTNAVRAGWTSNSRYGSLGLYGMGFNIATARLGRLTTIKTTRAGDPSWTVITLNLDQLASGDDYLVPVRHEPKDDIGEHGTQIIIGKLKPDQRQALSKQEIKIREQLGDVYSYLLREHGFVITVNGKKVAPRLPCVWDESRTVIRSGVEIPAVIRIDEPLPPAKACMDCGRWNKDWVDECDDCQSTRLELRGRRIWGWIGVQRYLHKSDYGIDFLRNGRKILIRSKRPFFWEDPDTLEEELEYPIDSQRGRGRIIGEIHCDHVQVNYQKNAFEYDSPEWRRIVRTIRGDSPLREKIAKRLGLPQNESPLAKLFTGYRREDPGLKYLVPGDGRQALFDKAVEWAKKFRDGHPDYQTDQIWYDAAYQHDHPVVPEPTNKPADPFEEMGLGDPIEAGSEEQGESTGGSTTPAPDPTPTPPDPVETLDQRLERYRSNATQIVDLSGRYEAPDLGSVELTVWAVRERELTDPAGNVVPVFRQMTRAPQLEIFIATNHPLLTDYGIEARDLAMIEVAEYMRVRGAPAGRDPKPLTAALFEIKSRAVDQKLTPAILASRAGRLLDRLRDAMQREIKGAPSAYWDMLQESERTLTQQRFAIEAGDTPWETVVESGDFVLYLPASALVRLLEKRPDAFLDGKVFKRPYVKLTDDTSRSLIVSRLVGYVSDLALMERQPRLGTIELKRVQLSCLLVEADLGDTE